MFLAMLELNMIASGDETARSFTHNVGLMNSGESHSCKFLVRPKDWEDCKDLEAVFYTDSGIIRKSASKPSGDETGDEPGGAGSSSGGCDAGLSALGLGVMLSAFTVRRKSRQRKYATQESSRLAL